MAGGSDSIALLGSVCWPIDVITDGDGHFRGYIMRRAKGHDLGSCVFRTACTRSYLSSLEQDPLGSIVHDFSRNCSTASFGEHHHRRYQPVQLKSRERHRIVLCRYGQLPNRGQPCPMGTVHFTPPELQIKGHQFSNDLRTVEHDLFGVATMLFMILHAGKQPYAQLDGGHPSDNIREMQFPYPLGEQSQKGTAWALEIYMEQPSASSQRSVLSNVSPRPQG